MAGVVTRLECLYGAGHEVDIDGGSNRRVVSKGTSRRNQSTRSALV